MKRAIGLIVCMALAMSLTACGGDRADKPEDVFRLLKDAAKDKDYGKLYDLMSKNTHDMLTKQKEVAIKVLEGILRIDKEKAEKNMQERFGTSSIEDLKTMSTRDFYVRSAENTKKSGAGRHPFSMLAENLEGWEFVKTEMGDGGKTAVIVTKNKQGKEERAPVILEDGGWKIDLPGQK